MRQSGLAVAGEEDVFQGVALQAADLVLNQGQGEYLFASGLAPADSPATDAGANSPDTFPFGNLAVNCRFRASDLESVCLVNTGVFVSPRAAASSACFLRNENGECEQFTVLGGAQGGDARVGELFIPGTEDTNGKFVRLESDGTDPLRRGKFMEILSLEDGRALSIGGNNEALFAGPPNMPTHVLGLEDIDGDAPVLVGDSISGKTSFGGIEATFRSHHEALQLEDGDVLVIGGLNAANLPTNQVLVFDTENEEYREGSLQMVRARFGHSATRIDRGLLQGAVLVTGGLSATSDSDTPYFVETTEIFVP